MLLTTIGPEALNRYNHVEFAEGEDPEKYTTAVKKLDAHFKGMRRVVYSRYQFWTYKRAEAQQFEEYLTTLQNLAQVCQFQETENLIRDKIVFSVQEKTLKERLLREEDLTLAKTKDICLAFEVTQSEVRSMAYSASSAAPETKDLHFIGREKQKRTSTSNRSQRPKSAGSEDPHNCTRCGTQHKPRHCPAFGQKCHKCNRKNHFAIVCAARNIHGLEETQEDQSSDEEFFLGSVVKYVNAASTKDQNAWFVEVKVCESQVKMKVDTGAEENIIPMKTWKKIKGTPQLRKSNTKLKALSNTFLEHHGSGCAQFQAGEITTSGEVFVTENKTTPILGLHTSTALGLVSQGGNFPMSHKDAVNTETPPLTLEMRNKEYTGPWQIPTEIHNTSKE